MLNKEFFKSYFGVYLLWSHRFAETGVTGRRHSDNVINLGCNLVPLFKLFLNLRIKNKYKNIVFASVFTKIEIKSKKF